MTKPILVVIFLRGGADGLSIVSPTADKDYISARPPAIRVARDGEQSGYRLKNALADVDFRFNTHGKELFELFDSGEMAVVHAAGLKDATRSHFDAEDRMERAAPLIGSSAGGWLGRWVNAAKPEGILPVFAVGTSAPDSLRGANGVAVADQINNLRVGSGSGHTPAIRAHLARMLSGDAIMGAPIKRLLSLSSEIEARIALDENGNLKAYIPEAEYPSDNPLANSLKTVAQSIKLDLGLRVSTVDFGGWDTHVDQTGQINTLIKQLSTALMAFWRDLGNRRDHVSVVVMSEFGRRLKSNESGGTDHGHGNLMMMLGGNVKGGQMFGQWPGLTNDALDEGADLAITTDYRTVLAEMTAKHLQFNDTATLFPGFNEKPLGYLS
jgi:uncharacterized protein (DUF1501 family)